MNNSHINRTNPTPNIGLTGMFNIIVNAIGRFFLQVDDIAAAGLDVTAVIRNNSSNYRMESEAKTIIRHQELEAELKAIVEEYGLNKIEN